MRQNPFLLPQADPFEDFHVHQEKVKELELEFHRLCFELFIANKEGQALGKLIHQQFLLPSHVTPDKPNAELLYVWWDGFKTGLRGLLEKGVAHQKNIAQGVKR